MRRKISDHLMRWKDSPDRKPLIINGARQVGKTYIIEAFGKACFKQTVYLNMEVETMLMTFLETELLPTKIVQYIEAAHGVMITAGETLLFFDEIQASERALHALKYFCEQMPALHVVAAGSLLGVAIHRQRYSFPVGKVDELTMYPFDFEEFLWAMNREQLVQEIKQHRAELSPMPEALHQLAIDLYQQYFIVGGMPAAIAEYIKSHSFLRVQTIQNHILNEYIADMAKYADASTSIKIRACYQSIPAQLAKENAKFQYKIVQRGGTATIFGEAIEWLNYAGIAIKCHRLEHGIVPINAYEDLTGFKLYMSDIGILTLRSEMPLQLILSAMDEDNTFLGAMTENYVAQALVAKGYRPMYWQSDGKAEVDFVLQLDGAVVPVEVKKGRCTRSRSLGVFMQQYNCQKAIRISKKNFGSENGILAIPLYAVFCL